MPFPLSCSGEVRIATEATPLVILDRAERALRLRGVGQIRREGDKLSFSDVSLDRGSLDVLVPVNAGTIAIIGHDNSGVTLAYRVSLVRFFLFTTLIWPVFAVLSLTDGVGVARVQPVIYLWALANLISYVATRHRFRHLLRLIAAREQRTR